MSLKEISCSIYESPIINHSDIGDIEESASKVSVCPLSDDCGSCQWMGHDQETQSRMRLQKVSDALAQVGLSDLVNRVRCVESPHLLRYRHRARFQAAIVNGRMELGYSKSGTREVVDVTECPVLAPELEKAYQSVRNILSNHPISDLTGIEITALPNSVGALVTLNPRDKAPQSWPNIGQMILQQTRGIVASVGVQLPKKDKRPRQLGLQVVMGKTPRGRPVPATSGFLHANLHMADILIDEVIRLCCSNRQPSSSSLSSSSIVAPLLNVQITMLNAGSGLLPWALANAGAVVTAIETNVMLVQAAGLLPVPQYGSLTFSRQPPKTAMSNPPHGTEILIVEPMRSGLGQMLESVCQFPSKHVIGIWCSLQPMAEEIATLISQGSYLVDEVVVVDFFPQTSHIETVVKLSRDSVRVQQVLSIPTPNLNSSPQFQSNQTSIHPNSIPEMKQNGYTLRPLPLPTRQQVYNNNNNISYNNQSTNYQNINNTNTNTNTNAINQTINGLVIKSSKQQQYQQQQSQSQSQQQQHHHHHQQQQQSTTITGSNNSNAATQQQGCIGSWCLSVGGCRNGICARLVLLKHKHEHFPI